MKFNKLAAALAVSALSLLGWSCTDEVEYNPTPAYTGDQVYFSNEIDLDVQIPAGAQEVNVELLRYAADGELTVGLVSSVLDEDGTDASAIITVPSSVTFAADSKIALIPVAVDFAQVVEGVSYTVSIAVDGEAASPYGDTSEVFTFSYSPYSEFVPVTDVPFEGETGPLFQEPIGGIVLTSQSLLDSNKRIYLFPGPEYSNLYYDYEVYIDLSQLETQTDGSQYVPAVMYQTDTHYDIKDVGRLYLSTAREFVVNVAAPLLKEEPTEEFIQLCYDEFGLQDSYYSVQQGRFIMNIVGYTLEGNIYDDSTILQLPGYADYYIEFSKLGNFVNNAGTETVVIRAYRSDDLASFAYTFHEGQLTEEEIEAAADAIKEDTDATLYFDQSTNLQFECEEPGYYTIVAVGYDADGNAVCTDDYTFEYETVQASSPWVAAGICEYTDDLLASLFKNFDNYTWEVEYEEHSEIPGYYRLVNPYKQFVEDINDPYFTYKEGKNYLYVHAENPDAVYIGDSLLGFVLDGEGPWYLTSQAQGLVDNGYSLEQCAKLGFCGTMVDGVVTMPAFSADGEYSNLLMVDEANYGKGWYQANSKGALRIDFAAGAYSAPAKKVNASGSVRADRTFANTRVAMGAKGNATVLSKKECRELILANPRSIR